MRRLRRASRQPKARESKEFTPKARGFLEQRKVYLIAGLGNPGPKYRDTRHNIGFKVIEMWSRELGVRLTGRKFQSRNTRTNFQGKSLMLLCPSTFMNQSGKSLMACVNYYDLEIRKVLIIHDDLDLPVGRIKVVKNGGAGGHKGVLSVTDYLQSTAFSRVKIGIGRPHHKEAVENYVLSPFNRQEKNIIKEVSQMAVEACKLFVSEGIQPAMNQINCQDLASSYV